MAANFARTVLLGFGLLIANPALAGRVEYEMLAIGLRWEASVEITAASGQTLRGSAFRTITGFKTIAGRKYFVSVTRFHGLPGMKPQTTYRRKARDGIYAINGWDQRQREYLETALPLEVGKTWEAITDDTTSLTVAAQEDLVVAGRRYEKCLKVVRRASGDSPSGVYYLAPNVGNVLEVSQSNGATYRFTLRSFSRLRR